MNNNTNSVSQWEKVLKDYEVVKKISKRVKLQVSIVLYKESVYLTSRYSVQKTCIKACCILSYIYILYNQILDMKTETSGVGEHQKEAQRTYLLTVGLKEGRGLVIRDRCGECINTTHPETLHTTYI